MEYNTLNKQTHILHPQAPIHSYVKHYGPFFFKLGNGKFLEATVYFSENLGQIRLYSFLENVVYGRKAQIF